MSDDTFDKLKESEAKYRAIFEASKVGIAMCRMDGSLVECNQAYLDIIGYTNEEALKLTYWDLTPRSYEEQEGEQLKCLQETGGYGPYQKHYIHKTGIHVPVLLNGTVLEGADGEDYIWSIVQDVSMQKLVEKQLQAALEEAEIATRSKSEFLSSMSHELRTPLNAILGFAQLLELDRGTALNEDQADSLDMILKGGNHLLDLIDQVLELEKIEAGKLSLSIESVTPHSVIEESLQMVKTRADAGSITLIDDTQSAALPPLWSDRTRLKQVLLNLLSNAIKYNVEGGSITLTSDRVADQMVRISVTDTGVGIPQDKQQDLFKPFERLGRETGEIEGTGIGLTISEKITNLLNGRIGFHSTEGQGSTFWVEIPVSLDSTQAQDLGDDNSAGQPDTGPTTIEDCRLVLYVEDNPDNMRLMEGIVKRIGGVKLITAFNAEIGIDLAVSKQPDLILMDINLPGMDGFEALAQLQNNALTKDTPVIALTAAARPQDIEKGRQAGFHDYITKPINVTKVVQTIETALSRSRPKP